MSLNPKMLRSLTVVSLAALAVGAPSFSLAGGENSPMSASTVMATRQVSSALVTSSGASTTSQVVNLPMGRSAVVDLPVDARDVVVGDPAIADAVMRTPRRVFLLGSKAGSTNVFFLDASGRQILDLEVRVARDVSAILDMVERFAPNARVAAESVGDSVVLTGEATDNAESDRVFQIARRFVDSDEKLVNLMTVRGTDQVMVKVRIVEMQRSIIKQLGINLNAENLINKFLPDDTFVKLALSNGYSISGGALGGLTAAGGWAQNVIEPSSNTFLSGQSGQLPTSTGAGAGGFSQAFDPATGRVTTTYGPGNIVNPERVDASIQALERVGVLRTLAEPNLTSLSGEPAKFLAGGEFPVPVAQDGDKISVEFKPFGVGLTFTPVVLGKGRISLKISTEVSEITAQGSYRQGDRTIRDAQGNIVDIIRGLTIPGITVRRAETTLEMPSGGSMVMAGLIQQRTRQAMEGLPGAKDIPVLGALFRSRDYQNDETELVVIVTPYLVSPTKLANLRTPGDGFAPATDMESLILGRINRQYKAPGSETSGKGWRGPFGHVVN